MKYVFHGIFANSCSIFVIRVALGKIGFQYFVHTIITGYGYRKERDMQHMLNLPSNIHAVVEKQISVN